ncbi:hypothetical protein ETH_00031020 [Eimeria tenella]|uniref:Uncharacterized protein n=1 Tax=Eimeria tenella TaxID=5802 RepID=U6KPY6_EIMTE|nr:hypothetical protein ETH_00031020 [Eimeria tenella]CDJ37508.1 hypothetical protein ETH_00031020 [Eimeria tenella]|eukprot:XP_013228346.1 hypothetical protein ETH_00031020 [Eimeria tenella]
MLATCVHSTTARVDCEVQKHTQDTIASSALDSKRCRHPSRTGHRYRNCPSHTTNALPAQRRKTTHALHCQIRHCCTTDQPYPQSSNKHYQAISEPNTSSVSYVYIKRGPRCDMPTTSLQLAPAWVRTTVAAACKTVASTACSVAPEASAALPSAVAAIAKRLLNTQAHNGALGSQRKASFYPAGILVTCVHSTTARVDGEVQKHTQDTIASSALDSESCRHPSRTGHRFRNCPSHTTNALPAQRRKTSHALRSTLHCQTKHCCTTDQPYPQSSNKHYHAMREPGISAVSYVYIKRGPRCDMPTTSLQLAPAWVRSTVAATCKTVVSTACNLAPDTSAALLSAGAASPKGLLNTQAYNGALGSQRKASFYPAGILATCVHSTTARADCEVRKHTQDTIASSALHSERCRHPSRTVHRYRNCPSHTTNALPAQRRNTSHALRSTLHCKIRHCCTTDQPYPQSSDKHYHAIREPGISAVPYVYIKRGPRYDLPTAPGVCSV